MSTVSPQHSSEPRTCLFTGQRLAAHTKLEHTIQRALGGRVRSRIVSSDLFNEMAGNGVDKAIAEVFAPVFNRIGLAMPSAYRPPKLPASVDGDPGSYEFDENGMFVRKGIYVEKDPKTRRPISATASNPDAVKRRLGWNDVKMELVEPPKDSVATIEAPLFDANTEIAALKSILLTFDHLLADESHPFTRDPALWHVRELVRRYVMEGSCDATMHKEVILGIQYAKLSELRDLRRLANVAETPFEHVMVVCGDTATRTLDAVWWVARIDPYGFRLCRNWQGKPFTLMVISGVMPNSGTDVCSLPKELHCRLEGKLRARQSRRTATRERMESAAREVATYHWEALQRAIDYTERHCPDHVHRHVARWACLGQRNGDGRIAAALTCYLQQLFEWRLRSAEKRTAFDAIVKSKLSVSGEEWLNDIVDLTSGQPTVREWEKWHERYVTILDALCDPLGLPGEVGSRETIINTSLPKDDDS